MYSIAKKKDRSDLFINTASKMKVDTAIVEKVFGYA